ncbi:hypothetical protein [Streptomyces hokutonensis]|uniref:hypothetical protein n=1 Tax=Streptomyces hokutonensis TaxID=1306990 RepID=UPI0033D99C93
MDRRDDPANRRTQLALLAEGARRHLERVAPDHVEAVRHAIFDALTPDQVRQFAEIGDVINSALQHVDATQDHEGVLPWRRR